MTCVLFIVTVFFFWDSSTLTWYICVWFFSVFLKIVSFQLKHDQRKAIDWVNGVYFSLPSIKAISYSFRHSYVILTHSMSCLATGCVTHVMYKTAHVHSTILPVWLWDRYHFSRALSSCHTSQIEFILETQEHTTVLRNCKPDIYFFLRDNKLLEFGQKRNCLCYFYWLRLNQKGSMDEQIQIVCKSIDEIV